MYIQPPYSASDMLLIEMLSRSIPVILFDGHKRRERAGCFYQKLLRWNSEDDLMHIVSNLDAENLRYYSALSSYYFKKNHMIDAIRTHYNNLTCFSEECLDTVVCYDDGIELIEDYPRLFFKDNPSQQSEKGKRGKNSNPLFNLLRSINCVIMDVSRKMTRTRAL